MLPSSVGSGMNSRSGQLCKGQNPRAFKASRSQHRRSSSVSRSHKSRLVPRAALQATLSPDSRRCMHEAQQLARQTQSAQLQPRHVLASQLQLLKSQGQRLPLETCPSSFIEDAGLLDPEDDPMLTPSHPMPSTDTLQILKTAGLAALASGVDVIQPNHIFKAMLEHESPAFSLRSLLEGYEAYPGLSHDVLSQAAAASPSKAAVSAPAPDAGSDVEDELDSHLYDVVQLVGSMCLPELTQLLESLGQQQWVGLDLVRAVQERIRALQASALWSDEWLSLMAAAQGVGIEVPLHQFFDASIIPQVRSRWSQQGEAAQAKMLSCMLWHLSGEGDSPARGAFQSTHLSSWVEILNVGSFRFANGSLESSSERLLVYLRAAAALNIKTLPPLLLEASVARIRVAEGQDISSCLVSILSHLVPYASSSPAGLHDKGAYQVSNDRMYFNPRRQSSPPTLLRSSLWGLIVSEAESGNRFRDVSPSDCVSLLAVLASAAGDPEYAKGCFTGAVDQLLTRIEIGFWSDSHLGTGAALSIMTSLQLLQHSCREEGAFASGFSSFLAAAAPVMSPAEACSLLKTLRSYAHRDKLADMNSQDVFLRAILGPDSTFSATQKAEAMDHVLHLGWPLAGAWQRKCSQAIQDTPLAAARLLLCKAVMSNDEVMARKLGIDCGRESDSAAAAGAALHETGAPPLQGALAHSPGSAAFCKAFIQHYKLAHEAQEPSAAGASLVSDMLALVLASVSAAAGAGPEARQQQALLSSCLSLPAGETLSARQALMLAWGAAVLRLELPDGWLAAMWQRVQPGLPIYGGSVGQLEDSDSLLAAWSFGTLQQVGMVDMQPGVEAASRNSLQATLLVPPGSSSVLAVSSALWALCQAPPCAGSAAASPPHAEWLDQAAAALIDAAQVEESPEEMAVRPAVIAGLLCLGQLGYTLSGSPLVETKLDSKLDGALAAIGAQVVMLE